MFGIAKDSWQSLWQGLEVAPAVLPLWDAPSKEAAIDRLTDDSVQQLCTMLRQDFSPASATTVGCGLRSMSAELEIHGLRATSQPCDAFGGSCCPLCPLKHKRDANSYESVLTQVTGLVVSLASCYERAAYGLANCVQRIASMTSLAVLIDPRSRWTSDSEIGLLGSILDAYCARKFQVDEVRSLEYSRAAATTILVLRRRKRWK